MKKCIICGSENLVKEQIGYSIDFKIVCKDCGLLQMNKKDYLASKKKEKFEESFFKIMKTEQIKEILSIYEDGTKIQKIINKIDDEYHGHFIIAIKMFKEYLKEHKLSERFDSVLQKEKLKK